MTGPTCLLWQSQKEQQCKWTVVEQLSTVVPGPSSDMCCVVLCCVVLCCVVLCCDIALLFHFVLINCSVGIRVFFLAQHVMHTVPFQHRNVQQNFYLSGLRIAP